MNIHYLFVILVIIVILVFQIKIFVKTRKDIRLLKTIFPRDSSTTYSIHKENRTIVGKTIYETYQKQKKEDSKLIKKLKLELSNTIDENECESIKSKIECLKKQTICLKFKRDNSCGNTIVDSINNYLIKNKNTTSDFYLIKDIVDRNVDTLEQEINSQVPIPLYLGLAGTMAGIIIGVGYLSFSGGLSDLINSTSAQSNVGEGINALFGGVAVAMVASICGILLTTILTWLLKNAISENEQNKHNFLSWMQAELLPVISNDAISALGRMTENLNAFNTTFSENAKDLTTSLKLVKETSEDQANLLITLQNIDVKKMATANALVYEKMAASTLQIETLAGYISNIKSYLLEVRQLTEKINDAQERTKLIEEMATYFKGERANLDKISSVVSHSIGEADNQLQNSVAAFKQSLSEQYGALIKHADDERQRFEKVVDQQQESLKTKVNQLDVLEKEIKNLSDIKTGISNFEKSIEKQNRKIEELTDAIKTLAGTKSGSAGLFLLPKSVKITAIIVSSIVALFCLLGLINHILYYSRFLSL